MDSDYFTETRKFSFRRQLYILLHNYVAEVTAVYCVIKFN